jgi:hypothetical protein
MIPKVKERPVQRISGSITPGSLQLDASAGGVYNEIGFSDAHLAAAFARSVTQRSSTWWSASNSNGAAIDTTHPPPRCGGTPTISSARSFPQELCQPVVCCDDSLEGSDRPVQRNHRFRLPDPEGLPSRRSATRGAAGVAQAPPMSAVLPFPGTALVTKIAARVLARIERRQGSRNST